MEYAIKILEMEVQAYKGQIQLEATTDEYREILKAHIVEIEQAIAKLKVDDTETKRYVEKLEDACCDCAEFEEFGYHDENCFVKKLKGE